jgi:hypothetical protein
MSQAPCIEYKSSFVKSELETVKLRQNYDDGTRREYKTPVFNGEGTIECFFYVEERFLHYAAKLEWITGPEMFDNFEEILTDTALEKWETRTQNIALVDRTMERYTQVIEEYILEYVDPLSKDYMIKYLKDFHRPVHTKPRDHATRMETLIRYTNRLPGTEPDITPQQTKNMIFESFPVTWRQSWIRAGKSLVTNTLAELVQFMANEQSFADEKDKSKKRDSSGNKKTDFHRGGRNRNFQPGRGRGGNRRRDREAGRGGGRNDNERESKYPRNGPNPDEECLIHGGHLWRKCNQNPRGDNYNPARGSRGNGRGRTSNGRGNYNQGRGRGFGRSGNTNGNPHSSEHHHMDGAPHHQGNENNGNNGQAASSPNAEHHHFDMIGNPPPAGQEEMPGWRG